MTDKFANLRASLAALKLGGPVSTDPGKWNAATDALDVELVAELLAERDSMVQAQPAAVSDAEIEAALEAWFEGASVDGATFKTRMRAAVGAILALRPQSESKWEGAEEWMPLAWELCAEENGEEACNELIWTGGPIPEPWGDRWLQYEDEAKRLIELVRKHVPSLRPQAVPMTDEQKAAPKLIGWRTENFLWETDDVDKARNWEPNIGVLPIFEGDPNTKLGSHGITAQAKEGGA